MPRNLGESNRHWTTKAQLSAYNEFSRHLLVWFLRRQPYESQKWSGWSQIGLFVLWSGNRRVHFWPPYLCCCRLFAQDTASLMWSISHVWQYLPTLLTSFEAWGCSTTLECSRPLYARLSCELVKFWELFGSDKRGRPIEFCKPSQLVREEAQRSREVAGLHLRQCCGCSQGWRRGLKGQDSHFSPQKQGNRCICHKTPSNSKRSSFCEFPANVSTFRS